MTDEELNLWERQPNVCRVLISREMGAWLKRRDENAAKQQPTVCDIEQIRKDLEHLEDADFYTEYERGFHFGIVAALDILNKYMKGEQG